MQAGREDQGAGGGQVICSFELCPKMPNTFFYSGFRKMSDKRGREKKRLSREVVSLRREVQEIYRNNERGIKVAKLLEYIDNID